MKEPIADNQVRFIVLAILILGIAFVRFLSLPFPNVHPLAAMALFGAAHFRSKAMAFAIPLAALFITDLVIGFHGTMGFVYGSFILIGLLGFTLRGNVKPMPVVLTTLAGSVLFFLVTNFGVWMSGMFYPKTVEGLLACYTAALPFFRNTLIGDFFFVGVLFGGFALLRQRFPVLAKA